MAVAPVAKIILHEAGCKQNFIVTPRQTMHIKAYLVLMHIKP
jgi:hypothetical protein